MKLTTLIRFECLIIIITITIQLHTIIIITLYRTRIHEPPQRKGIESGFFSLVVVRNEFSNNRTD